MAMTGYIDAGAFKNYCHLYFDSKNDFALRLIKKEYGTIVDESIKRFVSGIDELPTVEAEPVIHCKDCMFFEYKPLNCVCTRDPTSVLSARRSNDYCSLAVRKEENEAD